MDAGARENERLMGGRAMRERIYSIPLTDALREQCDCTLCHLEQQLEAEAVTYFLGPSMMEPDGRILTNEKGFCLRHLQSMAAAGNQLSLALMLDTHLNEVRAKLQKKSKTGLLGNAKKAAAEVSNVLHEVTGSCALCDKLQKQMADATGNLVYLWDQEKEFRDLFQASKGLCLPHMEAVLQAAPKELGGKRLDEFLAELTALQLRVLEELNGDVNWFTLKFDYRNQDADWKNSRDAVPRAVGRLAKYL